MKNYSEVIKKLGLTPLPEEGGFYKETYRSARLIISPELGERSESTAIYYLITPESFSALHAVDQDEIFHFYAGSPVEMLQIDKAGKESHIIIGQDIFNDQVPQVIVAHGVWQGTKLQNCLISDNQKLHRPLQQTNQSQDCQLILNLQSAFSLCLS